MVKGIYNIAYSYYSKGVWLRKPGWRRIQEKLYSSMQMLRQMTQNSLLQHMRKLNLNQFLQSQILKMKRNNMYMLKMKRDSMYVLHSSFATNFYQITRVF